MLWLFACLGAACTRSTLSATPSATAVGTPVDPEGSSGHNITTSEQSSIEYPPVGLLEPASGLLPSGTTEIVLKLTTSTPANCRWSTEPKKSYAAMPNDFQQGQGKTAHSTVVKNLHDLDERGFYVRCEGLPTGGNPDDFEGQTHIRVLGSWNEGYPRIANLWGYYAPERGVKFFAGYDLFIPYRWDDPNKEIAAIRAVNPNARFLHYQYATKGRQELDPLTHGWWNSKPGDPGYNCLLRDSRGEILLAEGWDHPMYNMTVPFCRTAVIQRNVEVFLSQSPDQGSDLAYDGIYWDLLHADISWLSDNIDSNLDGVPDDPKVLDTAYKSGMEDFFTQLRVQLPYAILMGNEAPLDYAQWLNGRLFEWQLAAILDGKTNLTWNNVVTSYRDWSRQGQSPHTTFIQNSPESLYFDKYSFQNWEHMPPAMEAEAAASYRRMRFGLATALMGDGLFSFDMGPAWHGQLWWYDEFGAPGDNVGTTLPPRGYLGQPVGEARRIIDNIWARQFENGLAIINPTRKPQTVRLPGTYCKLNGKQAPLFQVRVDDDEARTSGAWSEQSASYDQFGATVHVASAGKGGTITYSPALAYSGAYEVFTWVVPTDAQSTAVPITIHHADGESSVLLDETSGEIGWHSLGTYTFNARQRVSAVLSAAGGKKIVADAFKWVSTARYNDGSQVKQITLQPQDGIILLTSCYKP